MAKILAAGIFLVRRDGSVLICHPTNHAPDFWSIPKGKVDDGESLIDAARRETYEETNIHLEPDVLIEELAPVTYSHKKKVLHPFLVLEDLTPNLDWDGFEIRCNSKVPEDRGGFYEMDDYKWVSLDEAATLLHKTQAECIEVIKKIINEK